MAKSYIASSKSNSSDTKANNNVKARNNSNLMSTSMPSSALSKALYSNNSSANQRNNNSTAYRNRNIISKRNQIVSKPRQSQNEGVKKVSKSTRDSQVSYKNLKICLLR